MLPLKRCPRNNAVSYAVLGFGGFWVSETITTDAMAITESDAGLLLNQSYRLKGAAKYSNDNSLGRSVMGKNRE